MLRADVVCGIVSPELGKGQESGVLARAVVVEGAGFTATAGECVTAVLMNGPMCAALQGVHAHTDGVQPRLDCRSVGGFGIVRGARKRYLALAQIEVVGGSGNHRRQSLQGL